MSDETTQNTPEPASTEPRATSKPVEQALILPTEAPPVEVPPIAPETPPSPEGVVSVNNDIPANEPLDRVQEVETPKPNITIEKHGTDTTITEIMEPTAQMAGNEPLEKQREENLKLANETRQEKKREKIDEIMNLFAEKQTVTNDEVEKLLHVSDATATRYLDELEKERKIKQVGKTGKHTHYEKI